MNLSELINFVALAFLLACTQNVRGSCNFDALTSPCFQEMSRGQSGGSVNLEMIQRAFAMGMSAVCDTYLKKTVKCIEDATKNVCDGKETSVKKYHYLGLKDTTKYICEENIAEFNAHGSCVNNTTTKQDMVPCERILNVSPQTCAVVEKTVECTDKVMEKNCKEIHESLGHLIRNYLIGRLELRDCNIHHRDTHHDDHGHMGHSQRSGASQKTIPMLTSTVSMLLLLVFKP